MAVVIRAALIFVEFAEMVTVRDSNPAIFAPTFGPFIVYTSYASLFSVCSPSTSSWSASSTAFIISSTGCLWG